MVRLRIVVAGIVVFLLMSLTTLAAQPTRLVVYSPFHEPEITAMLDAFRSATGISASFVRAGTGEIVTRIRAERASPRGDVFLGGTAESHEVLALEGLLESHKSPEHKFIPPRFRDHRNLWHGFYVAAIGVGINEPRFEREIRPKGVSYPTRWEDLLHPAYKGEIVVAAPTTSGTAVTFVAGHVLRLGAERGWRYLEELDKNIAHYPRSGAAPVRLAALGEFIIGIAFGHDVLVSKAEGHPLRLVYLPGSGWELGVVSLIKGGPNPAAGRPFVDWVLGREGGRVHSDVSLRPSARADVPVPRGAVPIAADVILKTYDPRWVAQHRDSIIRIWEDRFRR